MRHSSARGEGGEGVAANLRTILLMSALMGLVTYLLLSNVMLLGPIYNHVNKLYMSLLMGTAMLCISVVTMPFSGRPAVSATVFLVGLALSLLLVVLIRQQTGVNERQFALGMIEHHQMAVLMADRLLRRRSAPAMKSSEADAAIRQLASSIRHSQLQEISEMQRLAQQAHEPV